VAEESSVFSLHAVAGLAVNSTVELRVHVGSVDFIALIALTKSGGVGV
jgi:hypothetical protein